jgi:isoleucyl-tRNA synthetase
MYRKVPTDQNFVGREKEVVQFWKEHDIFRKSEKIREGCPVFTFYDGPPTANGRPHIGHVETRAIKDMIPRYRTMKGYQVPRKAGWDTHGLPVELEVEKELGLNGKDQIEAYGIEPFIKKCKESVWKYESMWENFSNAVGYWADMDNPYVTYHDDYIESVWWGLKEIWKKGLLYKGFKIVPYCPRCGTPLSTAEVSQGYKTLKERSAIARFRALDEDNTYYLVWTTTPWTLPSNGALCVNADETYVKVHAEKEGVNYILAEALAETVIHSRDKEEEITVLERFKGSELEGRRYEPLFGFTGSYVEKKGLQGFFIACDPYVTMSDGTGIVHLAPAFGEDDARVGREYGVPFIQFVDGKGEMTADTPYAGLFVKAADPVILDDLKRSGKLFSAPKFEHEYPHCWRCDTPLIYYARDSWYIRETAVRDGLLRNNDTVNWLPESIGKGRFGNWLENIQDWAISRNRYWGTPLNIWECGCGHRECIGSRAELFEKSGDPEAKTVELHRPYIDRITLRCPECGGTMRRVPEVVDCWFDSGAMPFAQQHYPFENKEAFEQQFPASFISEAVDQTRGWFHSLMAESTLIFDRAPYENVVVLGLVQDENGQKMSKSKGNAVDPFEALNAHGADAIRWYFYSNSAPWLPNRFSKTAVVEGQRKFMGTLWNTYGFFVLYANIDEFDASKYQLEYDKLQVIDKWVLSKLNSLVKTVDDHLENYRITETARAMEKFVDELSNWYVRRCRERFWAKDMTDDKIAAYMTLYTCLVTFAELSAPLIPFMAEQIYQNLVVNLDKTAPESVHLCDYPTADEKYIDTELEKTMDEAVNIVSLGRACRNAAVIKNRQALSVMYINAPTKLNEFYTDIIKDELNVKSAQFTDDLRAFTTYSFKPQLKTLGRKLGKNINAFREYLTTIDGNAAMDEINGTGGLKVTLDGQELFIEKEDLLIDAAKVEGYESVSDFGVTVVLDTKLTEALIEEGFVREVISKLQTMRKDAGFEVMDRINVTLKVCDKIKTYVINNMDQIKDETLADSVEFTEPKGCVKDWNINGDDSVFGVEKV